MIALQFLSTFSFYFFPLTHADIVEKIKSTCTEVWNTWLTDRSSKANYSYLHCTHCTKVNIFNFGSRVFENDFLDYTTFTVPYPSSPYLVCIVNLFGHCFSTFFLNKKIMHDSVRQSLTSTLPKAIYPFRTRVKIYDAYQWNCA